MRPTTFLMSIVAFVLSVSTAVGQGLYIESKRSASNSTEKFWYMPHMFKSVDAAGKISIVRLDKEAIYSIDPEKKTYKEIRFAEMKNMVDTGKARIEAMMKDRMQGLPPDKRKEMEQQLAAMQGGGSDQTKYEVVSTGESMVIGGYPCSKYIVRRDGKDTETIWATTALKGIEPIRKDLEEMTEKMATITRSQRQGRQWFKEVKGFPIQTEFQGGAVTTVTHVEQRSVSPSEFEVPSGYTKEVVKATEEMGKGGVKQP